MTTTTTDTELGELQLIPLASLIPSQDNVRSEGRVDPSSPDILEMAISIKAVGILEPLLVHPHPFEDGSFEIEAGERRFVAAGVAKQETVPCIVRPLPDEVRRKSIFAIENLQREPLGVMEEAKAYQQLADEKLTHRDIAQQVGRSQSHVTRLLGLLRLPEVAHAWVDSGELPRDQALVIASLPTATQKELCAGPKPPKEHEIVGARIEHDREKKMAAAKKEAADKGLRVVDRQPGAYFQQELEPEDAQPSVAVGSAYGTLQHVTIEEHEGQECHAVFISRDGALLPACTDPGRHPEPEEEDEEDDDGLGTSTASKAPRAVHTPRELSPSEVAFGTIANRLVPVYKAVLGTELEGDDVVPFVAPALFLDEDPYATAMNAVATLELAEGEAGPLVDLAVLAEESMNSAAVAMTAFAIQSYHNDLRWIIERTLEDGTPLDIIGQGPQGAMAVDGARRLLSFVRRPDTDEQLYGIGTLEAVLAEAIQLAGVEQVEDTDSAPAETVHLDLDTDQDEQTEVEDTDVGTDENLPPDDAPAVTVEIKKQGKKFYRVCSECGPVEGFNTDEAMAQDRIGEHLSEKHGIEAVA